MTTDVKFAGDSASAIKAMKAAMRELPQVELDTHHHFADGMYCRVVVRKAGDLIIGKRHRKPHFYVVAKGRVAVSDGASPAVEYEAGTVIVSQPGTERAVLALEDSVCLTVHRTDETDLDAIEREVVEPDDMALFDARNKLIALGAE